MLESPAYAVKRIERRSVLQGTVAFAALGSALFRISPARAQTPQDGADATFAYVGGFTTPERKGHGGGINVYRVDPASGTWTHEQLLEIVNPSFLAIDRAQRFLYSVHSDLEEVSAPMRSISKPGTLRPLNRQSCGGKNPVHLSIDPTGRWIVTANYAAGSVGVVPIEKDGTLGAAHRSGRPERRTGAGSRPTGGLASARRRLRSERPVPRHSRPGARPDLRVSARCGEREIDPERSALRRHAQARRPAAHCLSSKDAVRVRDQRARFDCRHLPLRCAARQFAGDPDPAVYALELRRRAQQRRDRRRARRSLRLRFEPVQRQHCELSPSIEVPER